MDMVSEVSEAPDVPDPKTGKKIGILQSNEQFAKIKLADGSTLSFKACITEVIRFDERKDDFGNPLYLVGTHNVVQVLDMPADLKGIS